MGDRWNVCDWRLVNPKSSDYIDEGDDAETRIRRRKEDIRLFGEKVVDSPTYQLYERERHWRFTSSTYAGFIKELRDNVCTILSGDEIAETFMKLFIGTLFCVGFIV